MNEHIMRVLFGAQKQAKRQNEAMVNFIEGYIEAGNSGLKLESDEDVKRVLRDELQYLSECPSEWGLSDKLFVQYLLGVEAAELMLGGVSGVIVGKEAGERGKYVFYYLGSNLPFHKPEPEEQRERSNRVFSEYERANDSSAMLRGLYEDDAWRLIEEILAEYPADMRAALPEDDALAAVWLSQDYWNRRV